LIQSENIFQRALVYGRMIKFSHTVFALPFALAAMVLTQRYHPIRLGDVFWVVVALVGARSAAMGFNRLVDATIDARNPRTAVREIPAGKISQPSALLFIGLSAGIFVFSAAMLSRLCFFLSFPVLGVLFSYSYAKRYTWLCHLYLGFAISLAPLAAWLALAKSFYWPITLLSLALMAYIAGFDILYACQDAEFDAKMGLHSIPERFGVKKALKMAAVLHLLSFLFLLGIYPAFEMNGTYLVFVVIIGLLMIVEHWLVKPDDLSRVPVAFFHMNSLISLSLFAGVLGDEVLRRWM
jgi:4-hydroxybenzoate polyprenyltransferase